MSVAPFELFLADEEQMSAAGAALGMSMTQGGVIFLQGTLGMGKTTLSRGLIRGMGHVGAVKSPTFTLIEPYEIKGQEVYHFDLYRLSDPEELEFMGIRDYFTPTSICLIEWPDKGLGVLPEADVVVQISEYQEGRNIQLQAMNERGEQIVNRMRNHDLFNV
jgi:tRNA threonylcarbamoyladenosine biosynthesis protein TsaE